MSDPPPSGRLEAVVRGRVQGVGFRLFIRTEARSLGLTGWVANEPGGRVRCIAEGPGDALDRLEARLREGPPGAWVEDLTVERRSPTGEFATFDVRSGWHAGD
jgi:acylphosphatase